MNESTKFNPCAECASHCKPVFAVLLIGLGLRILIGEILGRKKQNADYV